jgi:uncharacterized protein (TIGR02598 family)
MKVAGFSLAEVTISLAIAAGGFITLLGLLPQGLEMSRRTAEMAATARIIEHVSGELMQLPWENLNWSGHSDDAKSKRYYDDQGIPLLESDLASKGAMLAYVASIYLTPENDETQGVRLPVGDQQLPPEKYVRRAMVYVASTMDKNQTFPEPGDNLPIYMSVHPVTIPLVKAIQQ